jgi:hypothetical protein
VSVYVSDLEYRVILGVGQLCEARAHEGPGDLAVLGSDNVSFVHWDLGSLEDLGLPLAAQLTLAGSSQITDPVRLAIRGNQIAAPCHLDGNDRYVAELTCAATNDGEGGDAACPQPQCQRLGQVPGEAGGFRYATAIFSWMSRFTEVAPGAGGFGVMRR